MTQVTETKEYGVDLRTLVPGFRLDWSGLRNRLDDAVARIEKLDTYEMRAAHLDELARELEDAITAALERRASDKPSEAVAWQYRYRYSDMEWGPWINERRADADALLSNNVLIAEEKRPLFTSSEAGSGVDQFIAAAKLLEDAGWKISRPTQPAESAKSGDGVIVAALADCIALLDTFAEVAKEKGESGVVDWVMASVMADKHRHLLLDDGNSNMSKEQTDLLPCPFCGASGDDLMAFCDPAEGRDNSGPSRRIQCAGCNIEAPFYDSVAEAIAAWNRRATPSAPEQTDWVLVPRADAEDARDLLGLYGSNADWAALAARFDKHCATPPEAQAVAWQWRRTNHTPWRLWEGVPPPWFSEEGYEFRPLYASPSPAGGVQGVTVKALEWGRDHIGKEWHGNVVRGTGYNYLVKDDGRWCAGPERRWVLDQIGDVEAAKAAAQSDYEARILSALSSQAQTTGGV